MIVKFLFNWGDFLEFKYLLKKGYISEQKFVKLESCFETKQSYQAELFLKYYCHWH